MFHTITRQKSPLQVTKGTCLACSGKCVQGETGGASFYYCSKCGEYFTTITVQTLIANDESLRPKFKKELKDFKKEDHPLYPGIRFVMAVSKIT